MAACLVFHFSLKVLDRVELIAASKPVEFSHTKHFISEFIIRWYSIKIALEWKCGDESLEKIHQVLKLLNSAEFFLIRG